jgi:hypothetical protein
MRLTPAEILYYEIIEQILTYPLEQDSWDVYVLPWILSDLKNHPMANVKPLSQDAFPLYIFSSDISVQIHSTVFIEHPDSRGDFMWYAKDYDNYGVTKEMVGYVSD